ncbi:hypothetical protein NUH88_19445 [Nisaea acidiphila]|uniref:Uncharacterized protein n=1 Tax=Nisaea acidiphila TaxID=1862145 RepID=A0A9J7AST8_9PROT|nr:hypothetical protein [Nisaea acidiphila]UUX49561.1 hypothetical protein NUH88_19445 [Nisaea acidiphila]
MSEGEEGKPDDACADPAPQTAASAISASAAKSAAAAREDKGHAPVEGIDFTYFLWLATVATAILASVSLLLALAIYVINFIFGLIWDSPLFAGANYIGIMRVTGFFAVMSVVAHALRLRMIALAKATQAIPFPDEIVAAPNTGDPSIDKFECVGRVHIHVYENEVADLILANRSRIQQALAAALVIAISDPVVRYSKDKIEHTLRMGLGSLLPLKSISQVTLSELRHRARSMRPPE